MSIVKLKDQSLKGQTVGMMIADPGQRTGLCWGTFKLRGDSSYDIVRDGLKSTMDFTFRDETKMAVLMAEAWDEVSALWLRRKIPPSRRFFIIEDFILDIRRFTMERNMLSPVRITAGLQGVMHDREVNYVFQQPAIAKAVTNDQLRRYGLWIPQKERNGDHQLDVRRHAIQAVRTLLA